jgi:NAD-dependent SIR2 family protein deacetylase
LRSARRVVVFTGAGMSKDSGIAVRRAGVLKLHKRLRALKARAWPRLVHEAANRGHVLLIWRC